MTRMVEIVDHKGENRTVNAISGDMLKHIQAEHLYLWAREQEMSLCESCRRFDANRISNDESFTKASDFNAETLDSVILDRALQTCIIDDAEGILITSKIGKKRSIARKSCVEFGWMVGDPQSTRTESYFHVKYVPEGRGKGKGTSENVGQNIFHRPASSGRYAVVTNVDTFKLGRNDITLEYAVKADERLKRVKALLISVMNTFVKLNGAHRNTQNPHLVDFQGIIAASTSTLPAPAVSALNPEFTGQIKALCSELNKLGGNSALTTYEFHSLADFAKIMVEIIQKIEVTGA